MRLGLGFYGLECLTQVRPGLRFYDSISYFFSLGDWVEVKTQTQRKETKQTLGGPKPKESLSLRLNPTQKGVKLIGGRTR